MGGLVADGRAFTLSSIDTTGNKGLSGLSDDGQSAACRGDGGGPIFAGTKVSDGIVGVLSTTSMVNGGVVITAANLASDGATNIILEAQDVFKSALQAREINDSFASEDGNDSFGGDTAGTQSTEAGNLIGSCTYDGGGFISDYTLCTEFVANDMDNKGFDFVGYCQSNLEGTWVAGSNCGSDEWSVKSCEITSTPPAIQKTRINPSTDLDALESHCNSMQ
jgi:hypothetical protein